MAELSSLLFSVGTILVALGFPGDALENRHRPCPMCGGTDRFRFDDRHGNGEYYCNGCGAGDGFRLLEKHLGWDFPRAAREVAAVVGVSWPRWVGKPHRAPRDRLRALLQRIWDEAKPVEAGDDVAEYLAKRGLVLEASRLDEVRLVILELQLELLVVACAAAHQLELGVDPLKRDVNGFRWRTRSQIEEGRSWLWEEDGTILFKAEASAWTPSAIQLQQVWTDPAVRRRGYASRALRDLLSLLLEEVPAVTLFVRADNAAAIGLYDSIGMQHVLDYRSVLL